MEVLIVGNNLEVSRGISTFDDGYLSFTRRHSGDPLWFHYDMQMDGFTDHTENKTNGPSPTNHDLVSLHQVCLLEYLRWLVSPRVCLNLPGYVIMFGGYI